MSEVKVPIELLERILNLVPAGEEGSARDEIQSILDSESKRKAGWRGGRPRGKTADLTGFERDGAKVISVEGDVCSVLCACGAAFSKGRRSITDTSAKLRCRDCFRKEQRDKAFESGTAIPRRQEQSQQ